MNGAPVPLVYVSSGQINFQMPLASPGAASVGVVRDNIDSGTFGVQIAATAPGIFMLPENQGAILNQDYSVNDPGVPARRGSYVMIYATGSGAVTPQVAAGQAAPLNGPLSTTPQTPVVTIGGISAQVTFSGLAPGYAGLWQINAQVPANAPTGDDIPVEIVFGTTSNSVTMAISQ
jgi:adhesin/invasin